MPKANLRKGFASLGASLLCSGRIFDIRDDDDWPYQPNTVLCENVPMEMLR